MSHCAAGEAVLVLVFEWFVKVIYSKSLLIKKNRKDSSVFDLRPIFLDQSASTLFQVMQYKYPLNKLCSASVNSSTNHTRHRLIKCLEDW